MTYGQQTFVLGLVLVFIFSFLITFLIKDARTQIRTEKAETKRTCIALLQHVPTYTDSLEIAVDFPKCTSLLQRK